MLRSERTGARARGGDMPVQERSAPVTGIE